MSAHTIAALRSTLSTLLVTSAFATAPLTAQAWQDQVNSQLLDSRARRWSP